MERIVSILPRTTQPPAPPVARALEKVGANIRLARLRRALSVTRVAEQAGMSRPTLRAVERGDPGVSIGAYANVLGCLGFVKDLRVLARDDERGRALQDAALARRGPRRRRG